MNELSLLLKFKSVEEYEKLDLEEFLIEGIAFSHMSALEKFLETYYVQLHFLVGSRKSLIKLLDIPTIEKYAV